MSLDTPAKEREFMGLLTRYSLIFMSDDDMDKVAKNEIIIECSSLTGSHF